MLSMVWTMGYQQEAHTITDLGPFRYHCFIISGLMVCTCTSTAYIPRTWSEPRPLSTPLQLKTRGRCYDLEEDLRQPCVNDLHRQNSHSSLPSVFLHTTSDHNPHPQTYSFRVRLSHNSRHHSLQWRANCNKGTYALNMTTAQ